ncbi:unnamed protein product, partial [Ectocarpus sp. 12 AP-2014]
PFDHKWFSKKTGLAGSGGAPTTTADSAAVVAAAVAAAPAAAAANAVVWPFSAARRDAGFAAPNDDGGAAPPPSAVIRANPDTVVLGLGAGGAGEYDPPSAIAGPGAVGTGAVGTGAVGTGAAGGAVSRDGGEGGGRGQPQQHPMNGVSAGQKGSANSIMIFS